MKAGRPYGRVKASWISFKNPNGSTDYYKLDQNGNVQRQKFGNCIIDHTEESQLTTFDTTGMNLFETSSKTLETNHASIRDVTSFFNEDFYNFDDAQCDSWFDGFE